MHVISLRQASTEECWPLHAASIADATLGWCEHGLRPQTPPHGPQPEFYHGRRGLLFKDGSFCAMFEDFWRYASGSVALSGGSPTTWITQIGLRRPIHVSLLEHTVEHAWDQAYRRRITHRSSVRLRSSIRALETCFYLWWGTTSPHRI